MSLSITRKEAVEIMRILDRTAEQQRKLDTWLDREEDDDPND